MKQVRVLAPGEHYHVYNRGVMKRKIFLSDRDRLRFLFYLFSFQSPQQTSNIHRHVQHSMLNIQAVGRAKIKKERVVKLIAFALMPNHFHLILEEIADGGISKYLQRLGNAYTKYFNTKYETNGHLFQGRFKFRHIQDNEQLLYTSAYLHRNCCELKVWRGKESDYPWSSYQDYLGENRWFELLETATILEQFSTRKDYQEWVQESGAKDEKLDLGVQH